MKILSRYKTPGMASGNGAFEMLMLVLTSLHVVLWVSPETQSHCYCLSFLSKVFKCLLWKTPTEVDEARIYINVLIDTWIA